MGVAPCRARPCASAVVRSCAGASSTSVKGSRSDDRAGTLFPAIAENSPVPLVYEVVKDDEAAADRRWRNGSERVRYALGALGSGEAIAVRHRSDKAQLRIERLRGRPWPDRHAWVLGSPMAADLATGRSLTIKLLGAGVRRALRGAAARR
jgi:hypothetical protein